MLYFLTAKVALCPPKPNELLSAKSTFVQMIPRLYDVTGGSVKVGGIDVREYNLEALRDQVSMVLQKNVADDECIFCA